ncbi:probable flap endonuclease 1 homolog isoform X4 [Anoplopoma fimbria]|uniref:probable flap endonuclease 1 homolog isoform X4 n=1 Tax=Anoplopoma fimbria TaxID=229290 RepID=UPI0023EDAABB|nr:probable flap endonuclease 1 homolog isoform X4 [Anoplopoma fimbria]
MGITKLADLIRSDAPDAISHKDISDYTGKVIALDTSVVVNQFRAATPSLSPLTGLFFRTLTFLEHDIKPVFVFDGKPPEEKTAVLQKRAETAGWRSANLTGAASSQTKDCLQLLKLLGVPVIQAPGDAEALCAQLVREGTVDAVASEDMDTLPFGANILIRQLNAKKDSEVVEYSLTKLLEKLKMNQEEFVDLCILLGCDYCDKIAGLGPKRALALIQKHHTIEKVVLEINRKYLLPSRPILCHISGGTKKPVRYSWMRHKQKLLNSPGLSRMKKPWFGSSVTSNMLRRTESVIEWRSSVRRGKPMEAADPLINNRKRPKSK